MRAEDSADIASGKAASAAAAGEEEEGEGLSSSHLSADRNQRGKTENVLSWGSQDVNQRIRSKAESEGGGEGRGGDPLGLGLGVRVRVRVSGSVFFF